MEILSNAQSIQRQHSTSHAEIFTRQKGITQQAPIFALLKRSNFDVILSEDSSNARIEVEGTHG